MPARKERTFSLSPEQSDFIDRQVASGAFASASEVVGEGLLTLQARDAAVERWLVEEVGPIYDEVKAHPEQTISGEEWLESVRKPHAARVAESK
jgi:antitoxin ParD1/3/4